MVDINLTLFVELVLFLIFMWGANRIAFRPMLTTMDQRADKIAGDQEAAAKSHLESERLEARYQRELLDAKRQYSDEFRKARRAAQDKQMAALADRRQRAETELAQKREEAHAAVDAVRAEYASLTPQLVSAIDDWALGGKRS